MDSDPNLGRGVSVGDNMRQKSLRDDVLPPWKRRWRKDISGLQVSEADLWREEADSFHGQSRAKVTKSHQRADSGLSANGMTAHSF